MHIHSRTNTNTRILTFLHCSYLNKLTIITRSKLNKIERGKVRVPACVCACVCELVCALLCVYVCVRLLLRCTHLYCNTKSHTHTQ